MLTVSSVPSFGAIALAGACALAGPAAVAISPAQAQQPSAAALSSRGNAVIRDSVRRVLDRALARQRVSRRALPSSGRGPRVITQYAVGHLDWAKSPAPNDRTLWDLASLTKVIGLTSGIMQLVAKGRIDLDAPVQKYLPELDRAEQGSRHDSKSLDAHVGTAGLQAVRRDHARSGQPREADVRHPAGHGAGREDGLQRHRRVHAGPDARRR